MRKLILTLAILVAAPMASASAQDEAKDEAWRTEGVQKLEFTRFVAAGKKVTLDFGYWLNPDCSPVEGSVEVKTTTEPEHGTLEFVSGERFTNYPKTSVRFKCNEKRTRGVLINYKSAGGYIGSDKFEILVLYPTGYAREVTYNLSVR
jgi:hypothetical protein